MSPTRVTITKSMNASPEAVWQELAAIEQHVDWMADAVALDFHSDQRRGVGTAFACTTKIGPFKTIDEMEIDRWEEGSAIGVTHRGAVTGTGVFTIAATSGSESTVTWSEALTFPWWMGGVIGSTFAQPIFRWIWRRNLDRLALRLESDQS